MESTQVELPSSSITCKRQFQKLITDSLCSIEILLDQVQAKKTKLTADSNHLLKHTTDENWESTIAEVLQEGARKAILGNENDDSSSKDKDKVSNLGQALIECEPIVALLESILGGPKNTEQSDVISKEKTAFSNVTEAINAVEDFCKVMSPDDIRDVLNELPNLAHILLTFYSFASELFFCMCTMTGVHTDLATCLPSILSLLLTWTDKSHKVRVEVLNNNHLFHHIVHIGCLSTVEKERHIRHISQLNFAIISNCALEKQFMSYLSLIDWARLLLPWTSSSIGSTRIHAKFLCSHVGLSLCCDDISLLKFVDRDMNSLIKGLNSASTSDNLQGTAFGYSFSAHELLAIVQKLIINPDNFQAVAQSDLLPSLVALFVNGPPLVKKMVCNLFWCLMDSPYFIAAVKSCDLPLANVFSEKNEDVDILLLAELILVEINEVLGQQSSVVVSGTLQKIFALTANTWIWLGSCLGIHKDELALFDKAIRGDVNTKVLFVQWLQRLPSLSTLTELSAELMCTDHVSSTSMKADSTCKPFYLTLFDKILSFALSLIEQLPTEYDKSTFELPEDIIQLHSEVAEALKEVLMLSMYCCDDVVIKLLKQIQLPATLKTLYQCTESLILEFLRNEWLEICYLRMMLCLQHWAHVSNEVRLVLIRDGYLCYNCNQLMYLALARNSEIVTMLVSSHLRILYCCAKETTFSAYFGTFDWITLLTPVIHSCHSEIQLHGLFLSGYLSPSLPDTCANLWELSTSSVDLILDLLRATSSRSDLTTFQSDFKFTSIDLITSLQTLIDCNPININKLILYVNKIIPICQVMLKKGRDIEKKATCILLWSLLENQIFKDYIVMSGSIQESLFALNESGTYDLKCLSKCVLMALQGMDTEDTTDCIEYIDCCYEVGRYSDTLKWCKALEMKCGQNPCSTSIKILRAKSTFQLYITEQRKLRFSSLHPKSAHANFADCYAKAKEAVGCLGAAFDAGLLDEEGQKFLDIAMMDLVHTANKLGECKRCYLCRNKLHIKAGKHHLSDTEQVPDLFKPISGETDKEQKGMTESTSSHLAEEDIPPKNKVEKVDEKKKQRDVKLIRSHFYPKAILKRMATGVPTPPNQKIFVTDETTVQAPGELTRTMLCACCEDTLSAYGESQFLPLFFDKIYDITNPSNSNKAQTIKYSDWLYNFCIGLIFRNIFWHSGDYVNGNELHELFSQCRGCLLSLQNCGKLKDDQPKPDIYLLITPFAAEKGDMQAGLMNRVLSGSTMSHVGTCRLDSDSFKPIDQINAQFFLVHMGCINVLVKFEPSKEVHIHENFRIQWSEGSHEYNIPSLEERKDTIPPGMWTFIRVIAEQKEVSFYKRSYQSQSIAEVVTEKPAYKAFGILHGSLSELQLRKEGAIPATDPKMPKQINLLPPQFHFRKPLSYILPENHHILLHHTFRQGQREGFSVFLAVGQGGKYSLETPYLIWYQYDPGLEIITGFFISRQNLKALEYLSEGKLCTVLKNPDFLADARAKTPNVVRFLLDEKGFLCLDSLLLRIETVQGLHTMDTKCQNESLCHYCMDRCNYCFQPAAYGLFMEDPNGCLLQFCSNQCHDVSCHSRKSTKIHVIKLGTPIPPHLTQRCAPVAPTHKEIAHLFIEATGEKLREHEIALCVGDGAKDCPAGHLYVVYFSRTLQSQVALEFFVSETFEPEAPLPYLLADKNVQEVIASLKETSTVQRYLHIALANVQMDVSYNEPCGELQRSNSLVDSSAANTQHSSSSKSSNDIGQPLCDNDIAEDPKPSESSGTYIDT